MPSSRSTSPSPFFHSCFATPSPFLVSIPSTFPPSSSRSIILSLFVPPSFFHRLVIVSLGFLLSLLRCPPVLSTLLSTTAFHPCRGRRQAEIHGGVCPFFVLPTLSQPLKFPWFFLVPSCVPPHNYRNDSVNSCALSPRSSSRASINLT